MVDTEHRRNLYRVIIGAQGVTLAARMNDLDDRLREKTNEIRNARTSLQRHVPNGVAVEDFIALPEDAEIDTKISAKQQELQAAQRAAQLQQREILAAVTVPTFPSAFTTLLAKTLENIAADAEAHVAEHIVRHQMQAHGETWLTEGLRYVVDELCPFCGQAVTGVSLIQSYRDFFSREYHALRDEVTALGRQLDNALADRVAAVIEQTLLQNSNSVEFWRQYCDLTPPAFPEADKVGELITTLRQSAQFLLQIKAGTPLEAVPPDDAFTQALTAFEALRTSLTGYNSSVARANSVIAARKQEEHSANLREVEMTLAKLRAQKVRHTDEVRGLCASETACRIKRQPSKAKRRKCGSSRTPILNRSSHGMAKALTAILSG